MHNTVLHQCLSSDQLVVAGIVHHVQDTALASDSCRAQQCMKVNKIISRTIPLFNNTNRTLQVIFY